MSVDPGDDEVDVPQLTAFRPAQFPVDLRLPEADQRLAVDAAAAIRQEYRDSSKWKKLHCDNVSIFAQRDRGTVFAIHVGSSIEFDWTWEGAIAFRPKSLDDNPLFAKFSHEDAAYEDTILWSGEVLEVDERNGCLFLSLNNPSSCHRSGFLCSTIRVFICLEFGVQ